MPRKVEIIDVSEVVPISPLTPRALRRSIVEEVAMEHGIDPKLIEDGNRAQEVVEARAAVARRLHALGMSERRIADVMHIQLKTAQSYLGTLPPRRHAPRYNFSGDRQTGDE
ncbi:hypothetical protein [Bradyrhizobium sp. USDA 313]|uniref:hypothetical protein n=1 Tax=Bradyrhizobium sp. USDA 313 TaxID=3156307 RepID=UPI003515817F